MKTETASIPTTADVSPARMESAPSEGPTVRSSRYRMEAGSEPERRTRARSEACCRVKVPVMRPASSMRLWISATDWMRLSSTTASGRPTLRSVKGPKRAAPSRLKLKEIWEAPGLSGVGSERGLRRARPGAGAGQVAPGADRGAADDVPLQPARLRPTRSGGFPQEHGIGRENPARLGRGFGFARVGAVLDQLDFEHRGGLQDALDARRVVHARQLHQDLPLAAPVLGDGG